MAPADGWRPDIDGLRAIAVLSVVLFHAGLPGVDGGFVGVDIFFVLSGFLIGSILFRNAHAGTFSFASFYARRARRILPALLALLAVLSLLSPLVLTPDELRAFGKSAIAAIFAVSNIHYWQSLSYFTPRADKDLLLMTWSLGVEEQFYLLVPPLMLLAVTRFPRHVLHAVVVATLASLLLSVIATPLTPTAAFYLLPTRAWELGAGVILAVTRSVYPVRLGPGVASATGTAGLALLIVAICFFTEATPFPGHAALLPVVGTMLLLMSEQGFVNRHLLGAAPMRAIGLVSYSWYLWHWPTMVILRLALGSEPPLAAMLSAAVVSLILGTLSWRFVEQPFRKRELPDARALKRYAVAIAAAALAPILFWASAGLPGRLQPSAAIASVEDREACITLFGDTAVRSGAGCDIAGPARIAIIGDSHADVLAPVVRQIAGDRGQGFVQYTKAACLPLSGASHTELQYPRHAQECLDFNAEVERRLLADASLSTVVVSAYWSMPFQPYSNRLLQGSWPGAPASEDAVLQAGIVRLVDRLTAAGLKVVVVGDNAQLRFDPHGQRYLDALPLRRLLAEAADAETIRERRSGWDRVDPEPGSASTLLRQAVAGRPGVQFVDTRARLCAEARCRFATEAGEPLYVDNHHLSLAGAALALKPSDIP